MNSGVIYIDFKNFIFDIDTQTKLYIKNLRKKVESGKLIILQNVIVQPIGADVFKTKAIATTFCLNADNGQYTIMVDSGAGWYYGYITENDEIYFGEI